jgi:hypothetical protein
MYQKDAIDVDADKLNAVMRRTIERDIRPLPEADTQSHYMPVFPEQEEMRMMLRPTRSPERVNVRFTSHSAIIAAQQGKVAKG